MMAATRQGTAVAKTPFSQSLMHANGRTAISVGLNVALPCKDSAVTRGPV